MFDAPVIVNSSRATSEHIERLKNPNKCSFVNQWLQDEFLQLQA